MKGETRKILFTVFGSTVKALYKTPLTIQLTHNFLGVKMALGTLIVGY